MTSNVREWLNRLRDWTRRHALAAELNEELRFHQSMREGDAVRQGHTPIDAQHATRRRLGNRTNILEETRAMWSIAWMDDLAQDIRYGLRALRRSPAFTITAALTLALGIGANSAIFTVLYRTGLQQLPVSHPESLVHVVTDEGSDGINYNLSYTAFTLLRNSRTLSGVAAHSSVDLALGHNPGAERVHAAAVSQQFFGIIGTTLARGRDFLPEEETLGAQATVILSDALWKQLGQRADVIGSTVTLAGQPFTVIGVATAAFHGLVPGIREELWVPLGTLDRLGYLGDSMKNPRASWLDVFGRLAPGVSIAAAQAEMRVLDAGAQAAKLRQPNTATALQDGSRGLTYLVGSMKQPLVFLMGVVGLVLLIACVNVANLLLARAGTRQREVAIRLAIGANRWRLVRQLLVESALLSAIGGVAALLVAWWGIRSLLSYELPMSGRLLLNDNLDVMSVVFTAIVALSTAMVFGLVPALRASRSDVVLSLKGNDKGTLGRGFTLRSALVIVQVALSLTLATGATLFLRSLQKLQSVDIGFTPGNVLLASVDLEQAGYDRERGLPVLQQMIARLASIPGVQTVAVAQVITPNPGGSNYGGIRVEGYNPPDNQGADFDVNKVSPQYFAALGVQILKGRPFDQSHIRGTPLVAIVNEAFVQRYSAGRDAIGQHLYLGEAPNERIIEIIGVAHDGKYRELRESATPNVYFPMLQQPMAGATLVLRTTGNPITYASALRREIAALNPNVPVYDIKTLRDHVATASAQDRMIATLSTAFGVLALMLAALGLFGVIAYRVARETRQIGIRMALGARPADVVRMIVRNGLMLVVSGLLLGAFGVWGLGRYASNLLFGVAPTDALSIGAAAIALVAAGLVAAWLPARRAARVDPLVALRSE